MIETLDDFAKAIFEDEENFALLCNLVKSMFELQNARDKAGEKLLKMVYLETGGGE